ncbi:MAG: LysM peptidoglycan-binding domain-containing protein [Planctomycetota bacterium]|nr:LysM peptidoglycan-binding domain-containing protein [Planctomycetota bacterium]
MNTLKTLVVLTVLVMVGYGLYVGLNNGFQFENLQTETPEWLHQEMQTENGIPQFTPPQITEPTMPVQPGAANSVANNVATGAAPGNASVAVPSAIIPSTESKNPVPASVPPVSVPQARYPANRNVQAATVANEQTKSTTSPPSTVVPSESVSAQSVGPVGIATSSPTVSPSPTAPATNNATTSSGDGKLSTQDELSELPLPAAIGSVPEMTIGDKLNLSQDLAFTTAMKSAKMQLEQGQLATALLTLSIWYEDPRLNPAQQSELTQLLDQVSGSVIYSRKHLIEPAYTVQQGETLQQIAQAHRVPIGLLVKINGIQNPQNLTPGQKIKVVRGPFNATVNGSKNELTLWLGGRYAGRFPLVMGPEFQSIVGPFVVHQKTRMHPERGNQPWIRLTPGFGTTDSPPPSDPQIGIAGMQQPETVAQGSTPGQMGVSVQDADDLYDILSQGSKVTIQR